MTERNEMQLYEQWCREGAADAATRKELEGIRGNVAEIRDRFYTDLEFGTAGMRGVLGAGTNRMNRYTVRKATEGYARFLEKHDPNAREKGVVIAHDNRRMSREFCMETAGVLAKHGIKAYIFGSLRPTPELSFAVRYLGTSGGVMITASHNPPEYNGYKLYDSEGCQLVPKYTDELSGIVNAITDPLTVEALSESEAGDLIVMLDERVDEAYYREVMKIRLHPDVEKNNLKVVYSPQHGTGNVPVREVLKRCGYHVVPVEEQCFPDKDFINTKSPNPEVAAAYEKAIELAKKVDADIAITTDPDCDRLGVVVKRDGEYVLMSGNQSGAVLLDYILSARQAAGTLPANAVMCNTVVTSTLGDRVCEKYGVRVVKTLTGFKFIGDKIHTFETTGEAEFVFGYEESYGCLISPIARDKDAVQASLMLCEAAAYYKEQGRTLLDVLDSLYAAHGYFLDAQTSVVKKGEDGAAAIAALLENLRKNPPQEADGVAVTAVEDYLAPEMQAAGFPPSNVLRFLLADGSWVAVRPSGTEPKCKYYYCVVGSGKADAEKKHAAMRAVFEK